MTKTRTETRDELLESTKKYVAEHEDAQGLLSAEDQAIVNSMLAAADQLNADGKVLTQQQLDHQRRAVRKDAHGRPAMAFIDSNGRHIQALAPDELLSGEASESFAGGGVRPGEVIRAMVTGAWGDIPRGEFVAMMGSGGAGGGYLQLTEKFSGIMLDLARAQSVLLKAGAQTLPMGPESELVVARLTQDATANWRREGKPITASTPLFGRIVLRPHVIAALVPISVELASDAKNIVSQIEASIGAAMGLALDKSGLLGSAAVTPSGIGASITGVFNDAGNSVTAVGTPSDYSKITTAIGKLAAANYPVDELDRLAWIAHPRDFETFDKLEDTTGQPLQPTPWAASISKKLSTTSLPTNLGAGAESEMMIGDFSEVVIGMRQGLTLEVFREGQATDETGATVSAFQNLLVWIRAYMRVDVATLRPAFFCKLSGVTIT